MRAAFRFVFGRPKFVRNAVHLFFNSLQFTLRGRF
jgi:hypothetical protein